MFAKKETLSEFIVIMIAMSFLLGGLAPIASRAASHREAPLISLDPTADITDFFMFRSYEAGKEDRVVLIMDVIPGEEPSSGPNYWNFDPGVLYSFSIDNNADGKANDIRFEFRFENEFNGVPEALDLFLSYLGNVPPGDGSIVPPITALEGPGSDGIGLRQRYTVTMVKHGQRQVLGSGLIAVPSNIGPRTMPDYESLAAQGLYEVRHGIRVFAGQRDDPFYIDLGAVFDTLNLRNPGVDMLSGFNVHTIALEVPARLLTRDGKSPEGTQQPVIGAYASTSRRRVSVLRDDPADSMTSSNYLCMHVQRIENQLVNFLLFG
jgi:hypothetical protein